MEAQKTIKKQCSTEQKEQRWRYHKTRIQTILQIHSNKSNIVLVQNRHKNQWCRREDTDMNPCCSVHLIFDKDTKNIGWRKYSLQQMLLGKLDIYIWKTETRFMSVMSVTLYKYQLKVD
jgi:hypothetical protein